MTGHDWSNLPDDPDEAFAVVGSVLVAEVSAAVAPWLERLTLELHRAWSGSATDDVRTRAAAVGNAAAEGARAQLEALVAADVEAQHATPLQILRQATRPASALLTELGVPPIQRDADAERLAPRDIHGLEPATLADVDPALHDLGLAWGAAKARAHLARRRPATATSIVALVPDLMDSSKLRRVSPTPTFVRSATELIEARPDVAVVDLTRIVSGDELSAIAEAAGRVVAFGPHVERDVIADAAQRGVLAMPRSKFFADIAGALESR